MLRFDEKIGDGVGFKVDLPAWTDRQFRQFRRLQAADPDVFLVDRFQLTIRLPDREPYTILPKETGVDLTTPDWVKSAVVERAIREIVIARGWVFGAIINTRTKPASTHWKVFNQLTVEVGEGPSLVHCYLNARGV